MTKPMTSLCGKHYMIEIVDGYVVCYKMQWVSRSMGVARYIVEEAGIQHGENVEMITDPVELNEIKKKYSYEKEF